MLVLSRFRDEKIMIDGGITITIISVNRDEARISVKAPPDVGIYNSHVTIPVAQGLADGRARQHVPTCHHDSRQMGMVRSYVKDQTILIGDDIVVVIISVIRGKVRLGIKAPKSLWIHREEVYRAIQAQENGGRQTVV